MPPHHPMAERRECPRISVDLPLTILSAQGSVTYGKIIDLSRKGAGILYSMPLAVSSELELRFRFPSETISPELRIKGGVRHNHEVLCTAGMPSDYRYVVGVEFLGLNSDEKALLEAFVRRAWAAP